MAVRTSPAGGHALPRWARTREGTDPGTVHLTVVEPRAVTAEAARSCCDRLAAAGYRRVVTNAMEPGDARALLDAGFCEQERLDLFGRGLDHVPRPTERARRTRRLAAVVAVDRAAFGPRGFDLAALHDALDATPRARLRVSGERSTPTGYAITGVAGRQAYVQRVAVDPDAQRRGIGRALVVDGLRWARRRGASTAVVNTHEQNAGACALYESLGFRRLPRRLVVLGRAL